MIDIYNLKFDENGLIPAVIADAETGATLMLAYMNEESLSISINEGKTCFWSRSRKTLWRKGETSGNIQKIVSIKTDCDRDALLVTVSKSGPACHTGAESCFFETLHSTDEIVERGDAVKRGDGAYVSLMKHRLRPHVSLRPHVPLPVSESPDFTLDTLYSIIEDRKANIKPGSYTNYLFEKGIDKILKKIGEESTEVIIAGKAGDKTETVYELSDLVYHAMVLMVEMGIKPEDIIKELASRHGEKAT